MIVISVSSFFGQTLRSANLQVGHESRAFKDGAPPDVTCLAQTNDGFLCLYGLGGNVVSCILEGQRGLLWMSTNKGVSSFDPRTQKFSNYTVADGLPRSYRVGRLLQECRG
jgi:hypothetical protein